MSARNSKRQLDTQTVLRLEWHLNYPWCRSPLLPCVWNRRTLVMEPQIYRKKNYGRFQRLMIDRVESDGVELGR